MTYIGTSHFIDLPAAVSYYRGYGYSLIDVQHKVDIGEIHLGPPHIKNNEHLITIDRDTRYAIVTEE